MSIKVTPLNGSGGVVVEGIDLTSPINDAQFAVLRQAFLDNAPRPMHPGMQQDAWDLWKSCRDVA